MSENGPGVNTESDRFWSTGRGGQTLGPEESISAQQIQREKENENGDASTDARLCWLLVKKTKSFMSLPTESFYFYLRLCETLSWKNSVRCHIFRSAFGVTRAGKMKVLAHFQEDTELPYPRVRSRRQPKPKE